MPETARHGLAKELATFARLRGLQMTSSSIAATVVKGSRAAWLDAPNSRLVLDLQSLRNTPALLARVVELTKALPSFDVRTFSLHCSAAFATSNWRSVMEPLLDAYFETEDGAEIGRSSAGASLASLISSPESEILEFKESARINVRTGKVDKAIEASALRAIAGFMNARGGNVVFGVSDAGEVTGLLADYASVKPSGADGYHNWLTTSVISTLGEAAAALVRLREASDGDLATCIAHVTPSARPVFTRGGEAPSAFFVRVNNSTRRLMDEEMLEYVIRHFPGYVRGLLPGDSTRSFSEGSEGSPPDWKEVVS